MTADFACLECRLIIEIDGESHAFEVQALRDELRQKFLQQEGFSVLRVPARDVLLDLESVVRLIVASCSGAGPLHHPADGPPPRSGEDR